MTDYHIARPEEKALIDRITKAIAQPEASPMMFYVWGIGGVGKSTILNKTQEKLEEQYKNKVHFTKFSFATFTETPLDVMVKLHENLPQLGLSQKDVKDLLPKSNLDPFAEKYKTYKETLNALLSEPIDKGGAINPEQIGLAKQVAKLALNALGVAGSAAMTMGINTPLSSLVSSVTSTTVSNVADTAVDGAVTVLSLKDNLLAKHRATQKAEIQELMLEPLPKLTQAFVETLVNHAKRVPVVLIVDTYEKVSPDVDRWLREVLLQNKELKNSKVRILMAGRFQLFKKDGWKELSRESKLVQETPLKIFEKEQTKSYLEKIGVSDRRDIEKLNKLTKGLPFYLDLIRKKKEDGEPINFTEEISERLFKGLTEQQKSLLQLAACCRWFDKPLLQKLVACRDLDFVTGVDPNLNCFEWLKGYDLVDFVEDSNYRYCLKDVARDVIRQSLHGNSANEFRNIHSQLQKYFEELADREVPPNLYESEKYENEIWCRYTAESIYHAFFNLRRDECKQYFLNHFFASRFFNQISVVIAPFTAILSEAEVSENILLHQENKRFLEDIKRLIPFGWLIMNSPPSPKVEVNDAVLPKALLETIENGIEKCFEQIDSLSDGVAKWTALMSKSWRCRSGQELDVLKQAEQQANLLENKINPDAFSKVFFEVANSYISLKKYEEAITAYDKALQIKPDLLEAWNLRGIALRQLDRSEEAITSYDKALKIKPDCHEAWNFRGIALINLGRNEEALISYDKALQLKPDLLEAWNLRGIALSNLGRNEEAIAAYDKALKLKPDYHEAFRGRGISLTRLGQYDKALTDFNQAIESDPNDLQSRINRGVLFAWMGRYAEGTEACDGILQNNPNHVDALYGKACCYALQKNIDDSIKYLTLAIDREADETKKRAKEDPEFDGIRDDDRFQELVSG
ncbi:tetratricopeptide repeat protein [Pseudanabaena sp. BC1403]|uniref:tetratricopeptide repeat protein n=1 Tax=Pseudanabaena sp. BC1403 TaxID=2043171 RepID=UPI000CD9A646|nr:tetratricopeptide repeat protein [Pseudanabaena sp. BC1403]